MDNTLVEWQKVAPNGLVYPWWTHPFLDVLETWYLKNVTWLEFGAGRSTAWLRSKCKWVDSVEANVVWLPLIYEECANNRLNNGNLLHQDKNLPDGVQGTQHLYFDLIPKETKYDIISVDGIWRTESLQFAINHFKGREGIIVVDNMDQDFVWISPSADELMKPYEVEIFIQPGHINHEGKPWNTRYYKIPA